MDMFGFEVIEDFDISKIPTQYHEFLFTRVKKTIHSHPYNYDPFLIYINEEAKEHTSSIYTDRLLQWDRDKHNRLCEKHFGDKGQYWNKRDPKKIEAFLSDWYDKKVILVANIQYVNVSNGFPYWRLDFYYE